MDILRKASHVGVVGRSGQGKTSYGERYIAGSHHGRIFIFDHQGEFFIRLKLEPAYQFEEMLDRAESERVLCYDPAYRLEMGEEMPDIFNAWCLRILDTARFLHEQHDIETLLVCDEVQKLQGPHGTCQGLKLCLQTGRRVGLDTLLLSQQPNRLGNEIREQWTELVCFKLIDDNSLKFADSLGLDTRDIQQLPDLSYKWFNTQTGETRFGKLSFGR